MLNCQGGPCGWVSWRRFGARNLPRRIRGRLRGGGVCAAGGAGVSAGRCNLKVVRDCDGTAVCEMNTSRQTVAFYNPEIGRNYRWTAPAAVGTTETLYLVTTTDKICFDTGGAELTYDPVPLFGRSAIRTADGATARLEYTSDYLSILLRITALDRPTVDGETVDADKVFTVERKSAEAAAFYKIKVSD